MIVGDVQTVLVELTRWSGGSATTKDVFARGKISWGRVRRAFDEAEAAGLVTSERKGGRGHGRAIWWTLTDEGQRWLEAARERRG